jgi:hypothetical protein
MAPWPDKSGLDTRDEARGIAVKPVRVLLSLLACLLSACATPHWVKPEASKSDLAQDQAACVQAIQQPPPAGTTDQQQYEACMNAHGWKLQQ